MSCFTYVRISKHGDQRRFLMMIAMTTATMLLLRLMMTATTMTIIILTTTMMMMMTIIIYKTKGNPLPLDFWPEAIAVCCPLLYRLSRWPSGSGVRIPLETGFFRVEPYQWLFCQAPGIIGSALELVGPVSVYCDWMK